MKATRRLDVLSIIGGILAVGMLTASAIYIHRMSADSYCSSSEKLRQAMLKCLPTPDMRADLELAAPWDSKHDVKTRLPALRNAVKDYPQSARLQLRLGALTEGAESTKALEQAARLDPTNALPIYLLANKAVSSGKLDESISLVKQANSLNHMDWYPLPFEGCKGDGTLELDMIAANSSLLFACNNTRTVSRRLTEHASSLHATGKTPEALLILSEVKKTGWNLIRKDKNTSYELMVGIAIVQKAHKVEKKIYTETHNQTGLEQVARENKEMMRLKAGGIAWVQQCNDILGQGVNALSFVALSSVVGSGIPQAWLLLVCLLSWGILALRSRGIPASEYHEAATERAFPAGRLVKVYALMFVVLATVTAGATRVALSAQNDRMSAMTATACMVIPRVLALVVLIWAAAAYRRSYKSIVRAANNEAPAPWKGYPIADKRERQRRLTGVCGGMVITLALMIAVLTLYSKTTMNSYPWEIDPFPAGIYKLESKYVADLVAGKVKVPETYIKAEQKWFIDSLKTGAKPFGRGAQ